MSFIFDPNESPEQRKQRGIQQFARLMQESQAPRPVNNMVDGLSILGEGLVDAQIRRKEEAAAAAPTIPAAPADPWNGMRPQTPPADPWGAMRSETPANPFGDFGKKFRGLIGMG